MTVDPLDPVIWSVPEGTVEGNFYMYSLSLVHCFLQYQVCLVVEPFLQYAMVDQLVLCYVSIPGLNLIRTFVAHWLLFAVAFSFLFFVSICFSRIATPCRCFREMTKKHNLPLQLADKIFL